MIGRFLNNKSKFYQRKYKKNFLLIVYLVCVFMIALLCMLLLIYNRTSEDLYYWAWRYNSPFIVVGAVALFLFFNSLRIRRIWINYIASSTFSVYLIHENIYASKYLYTHIRTSVEDMNFVTSIVYLLSLALLVFSGCIIIDIVRRLLFDMFNKIRKLSLTSLLQR